MSQPKQTEPKQTEPKQTQPRPQSGKGNWFTDTIKSAKRRSEPTRRQEEGKNFEGRKQQICPQTIPICHHDQVVDCKFDFPLNATIAAGNGSDGKAPNSRLEMPFGGPIGRRIDGNVLQKLKANQSGKVK